MGEPDLPEFSALLDAVCSLLSRGAYVPNATNTALFFRAMSRHALADVRAAFDGHVADPQRGRFVPVPADLIAQIEFRAGDDGRPGAEEAWSIALAGRDEAETIVWTAEIAQAWGVVQPVMQAGDLIGARMAFKEAYSRIVGDARAQREPLRWIAALGHDSTRHLDALRRAADLGRLVDDDLAALAALPAPRGALLLGGGAGVAGAPSEQRRQVLAAVRAAIAGAVQAPSADQIDRERTAGLMAQSAALVTAFTTEGIEA